MKKTLLSSLLLSSLVLADKIAIPMPASVLSVENSGTLSAIEAYQDGVGIYTIQQVGGTPIDNSEMNELVYKYGTEAKATGVEVKAYVNTYGDASEKIKALSVGKFEPMVSAVVADSTVCDDGNSLTINDKYTGGICSGLIATSCNDLLNNGITTSGVYSITPKSTTINAYCDMTSDGGGWTMVVAQYEDNPVTNWNMGIQSNYDPSLNTKKSFTLNTNEIPNHSEIALGKDLIATVQGYSDFNYTTGNISGSVINKKTGKAYYINRTSTGYYGNHNVNSGLTSVINGWQNTLTYVISDNTTSSLGWAFSPNISPVNYRGYAMNSLIEYAYSNSYAWTVWVR